MRSRGINVIARLAFCGFLLGVSVTGAANEPKGPAAGSLTDARPVYEPLDAYCESDCCWAYCSGYSDCEVNCSSGGCSASGGDESAKVSCNAT